LEKIGSYSIATLGKSHSGHLEQVSVCSLRGLAGALIASVAAIVIQAFLRDAKIDTPWLRGNGGIVEETKGVAAFKVGVQERDIVYLVLTPVKDWSAYVDFTDDLSAQTHDFRHLA
jgi:hypothetical protein